MKIAFELPAVDTLPLNRKSIALRALIEAMVVVNWNFLLEHPETPVLADFAHDRSVKINKMPSETWRDISEILRTGVGSAKDFACWRIAELRNAGEDDVYSYMKVVAIEPGVNIYQVFVRRGMELEDPSEGIAIAP